MFACKNNIYVNIICLLEPSMAVYMFEYLVVANERNFKVNNSKKNYCIFMKYSKSAR